MADVFVVGALHLDVIVTAPGLPRIDETVVGQSVEYRLGGKGGNQAIAARRFGAAAEMAGRVGRDEFGDRLLRELDRGGVAREQVHRVSGASGMSVAIVNDSGDYGAVIVSGANLGVEGAEVSLPEGLKVLLLQNELPERVNLDVARRAGAGTTVILNAAPARTVAPALLARVDLLVVNRLEAAMLTGQEAALPDPLAAALDLLASGPAGILVTLGTEGCVGAMRDGREVSFPGHAVSVVSTHGAGDAFVGALAARLAHGDMPEAAIRFAQAAAALHVSVPVDSREGLGAEAVAEFLGQSTPGGPAG